MKEQGIIMELSNNGVSDWTIVIGKHATKVEKYAASELRKYIVEIGEALLPIVADDKPPATKEIWVGKSARWTSDSADEDQPGAESFVIRTGDDYLLIAGDGRRGTLYGVYTFLEKYLGCRWYTPTVSSIPRRSRIAIGPIDDTQKPALEYREPFYTYSEDPDWAARNKCNGHFSSFDAKHGGGVKYTQSFVHSFNDLVPVEQYFESHPEYFSEIDGVRISHETQLCLANPDVFDLSLARIRTWLDALPEASIVTVSQNDWDNPCHCAACRQVDEEEGNYSGSLIRFVNRIAEALEQDYPHVAVDTLAYQYTRKAPKHVRPRPNVIVRLCSIECCFSHPIESCSEKVLLKNQKGTGATFVEDLRAWGRICNRLYVWDYVTNFANYVLPFPNLGVLGANVRLYARNNVKGLFEQGSYGKGGGGEFAELRAYMLAKLLWDPELDEYALMDEFLVGVYGSGGIYIRRYIDELIRIVNEQGLHASIYDRPDSNYLTPELLAFADEMFDHAERLAQDDNVLVRVRKARLPIRFAKLAALPLTAQNREVLLAEFEQDVVAAGITQLSEHIPVQKTMDYFRKGVHLTHFARYEGGWIPFDDVWPTEPIAGSNS